MNLHALKMFFTADEHYGHKNLLRGQSIGTRPFDTLEEMEKTLIDNHNAVVTDRYSLTFHIGDMFWKHCTVDHARKIIDQLRGAHILIFGNHDEIAKQIIGKFQWVKERAQIKLSTGQVVILDHYAGLTWNKQIHGSWQLYGHSHGQLEVTKERLKQLGFILHSFDAGVDCNNFRPLSEQDVINKMQSYL